MFWVMVSVLMLQKDRSVNSTVVGYYPNQAVCERFAAHENSILPYHNFTCLHVRAVPQ